MPTPALYSRLSIALLLAAAAHAESPAPFKLACNGMGEHEAKLIQSAGVAAKVARKSLHELQVKAGGQTLSFKDEPPFDEPLDGKRFYFCDYREGFFLLTYLDGADFTGQLVNEATGAVLPGGESVLFSADRRAYLAEMHSDGLDGNEWEVHAVDGRLSWNGYDFILDPNKQGLYAAAYLEKPVWTAQGRLTATAVCDPGYKATRSQVTLTKIGADWSWRPTPKCVPPLKKG